VNKVTDGVNSPLSDERGWRDWFRSLGRAVNSLIDTALTAAQYALTIQFPFDVHLFYPGVPAASALLTRVPLGRAVNFPSGLSGSYAKASVAATASTTFTMYKNGFSVATIVFGAGSAVGTFSSSGVSYAAGDVLSVQAPATADATLANVGIVLVGVRV
jgi:hypothetical protein